MGSEEIVVIKQSKNANRVVYYQPIRTVMTSNVFHSNKCCKMFLQIFHMLQHKKNQLPVRTKPGMQFINFPNLLRIHEQKTKEESIVLLS